MGREAKKVKCEQCKREKLEYKMLYVVIEDAYFCGQKCWDKHNGIIRE